MSDYHVDDWNTTPMEIAQHYYELTSRFIKKSKTICSVCLKFRDCNNTDFICLAEYRGGSYGYIYLTKEFYLLPDSDKEIALVHELCHILAFCNRKDMVGDPHAPDSEWARLMKKLGFEPFPHQLQRCSEVISPIHSLKAKR